MITYTIDNSLYLNITNRCTCDCNFCVRNSPAGLGEYNLWLEREPTVKEVLDDIEKRDLSQCREIVFCGYGEPMIRLYDLIEISKKIKGRYNLPIRVNTNGHGSLIFNRDITPLLEGWINTISISLNAKNAKEYQGLCKPVYGEKAFPAVLDFAAKCKKYIPRVVLSVVNVISVEDIEACRELAQQIGVEFRVRHFGG
ncbi:radical SAM protein [Heliobacterium chlorum]|uniref:Radical SAM protein n=1 Tax=Heliobacterium chlorum TaxID=2698 RepID=A0ABR7T1N3_HELCL|nr:radical SAM protein [Heliobacterium chlorum]